MEAVVCKLPKREPLKKDLLLKEFFLGLSYYAKRLHFNRKSQESHYD
jgi:hypothetical protein